MVQPAVRIVEVGPRGGLQDIEKTIPTEVKAQLIQRLAATGLRNIEAPRSNLSEPLLLTTNVVVFPP